MYLCLLLRSISNTATLLCMDYAYHSPIYIIMSLVFYCLLLFVRLFIIFFLMWAHRPPQRRKCRLIHCYVSFTKHHARTVQYYTTCGNKLLPIRAVNLDQFCRGAWTLFFILKLNFQSRYSVHQLKIPKIINSIKILISFLSLRHLY